MQNKFSHILKERWENRLEWREYYEYILTHKELSKKVKKVKNPIYSRMKKVFKNVTEKQRKKSSSTNEIYQTTKKMSFSVDDDDRQTDDRQTE